MAGKRPFGNPVPVSDLATEILDPMLRKRAGISVALVQSWEEIVGPKLATSSRPEKINWPRRLHDDDLAGCDADVEQRLARLDMAIAQHEVEAHAASA